MSLEITIPFADAQKGGEDIDTACPYFAIHNPLVIRAQRKDYTVTGTANNGSGKIRVTISGTFAEDVPAGDFIYINAGDAASSVVGTFQVLTNVSSGASTIDLDEPFVAITTGGFINLVSTRTNYYIQTTLIQYTATMAVATTYVIRPDVPGPDGLALIDVARNFRKLVTMLNTYDYKATPQINQMDKNVSWKVGVKFLELWDDSAESESSITELYIVNAAMQIQSQGGVCMVPHFPYNLALQKAKFLTDMSRPKMWTMLPFDTSFIFSQNMHNTGQVHRYEMLYLAGVYDTTNDDNIFMPYHRWVNRLQVKNNYTSSHDHILLFLGNPSSPDGYFDPDYIDIDYFDEAAPFRFTEQLYIRLEHCLPPQPVFLAWINSKGGWNYFCFSRRQYLGRKTSSSGQIANFPETLETMETTHSWLDKQVDPYMILGAEGLDFYDWEGIDSLIDSPRVLMLKDIDSWNNSGTPPPTWLEVRVDLGDYRTRDTRKVFQSIQFKCFLSEKFVQAL